MIQRDATYFLMVLGFYGFNSLVAFYLKAFGGGKWSQHGLQAHASLQKGFLEPFCELNKLYIQISRAAHTY